MESGNMLNQCIPQLASSESDSPEWLVISGCLKRVRSWRVPPRWSNQDWFEEMRAEATLAALQAARDFDPTRGVPWSAFLRRRILDAALTRYRREWAYATRRASVEAWDEVGAVEGERHPSHEAIYERLQEALGGLPRADAWLIEGLFWEGKTEAGLGVTLGISQQAVSKRKKGIFKRLRRAINTLVDREDYRL